MVRFLKVLRSLLFAGLLLPIASARADVITLGALQDTTIYSQAANSNGAGPRMDVGRTNTGDLRRGLIEFDVAGSIPAGAQIQGVTLSLFLFNNPAANTVSISLHSVLAAWGEGTSSSTMGQGAAATPGDGDATWLYRFYNTDPWTNAGGDYSAIASASTTVGSAINTFYTWGSTSGMVADV